jgi:predicted amino acid racemase
MIGAGVSSLGDSRIANLKNLRGISGDIPLVMLRIPMKSEAEDVVRYADVSLNSDLSTLQAISRQAARLRKDHGVIIMVETGDMREGIAINEVPSFISHISHLPGIRFEGIGTNIACVNRHSDILKQVRQLALIAGSLSIGPDVKGLTISGGNSSVLRYVFNGDMPVEINQLRIGESILLGVDSVTKEPIEGLYQDAFLIETEIIETAKKDDRKQAIAALGTQDVDPEELSSTIPATSIRDATSDHLMLDVGSDVDVQVGQEIVFRPGYKSLVRAMTSSLVEKDYR